MTTACLLLVGTAFLLSCPLTALARRLGLRWNVVDRPGDRKIHDRPIPTTGGIAIFAALILPLLGGLAAVWGLPESLWQRLWPDLVVHLPGLRAQTPLALAVVAGAAILHVTGLIDDRRALGPLPKLLLQLAAAGLVVAFGVRLLEMLGPLPSILLTLLWCVALTNAFNFLDNMDGLAAGVAAICGSILLAAALVNGQWFVAATLGLLVGSVLGFLVFNFPSATVFMGDAGSLVVGFVMSLCAVGVTYYDAASGTGWWAVFTPLVVLAIPLYDLVSVTLIRLRQGRSPLVGDTQHFSHRLVRKGLSRTEAVGVIWACTLATALGGIMLGRAAPWQAGLVVAQTASILGVLALLERSGRRSKAET